MNAELLNKSLKQLLVLILLFIVAPISLNIGFKAINSFENDHLWIAYVILGISGLLVIAALVLAFKTMRTLLDAIFNSKNLKK
jgi:Na+/H+ antiporter NhaC